MDNLINKLKKSNNKIDLTNSKDQNSIERLADEIIKHNKEFTEIHNNHEKNLQIELPLQAKVAIHLAESKIFITNSLNSNFKVAIIYAMWGEHNRLLQKSDQNPNGENSLIVKIEQLKWLTKGSKLDWTIYAVDDGCPHESGKIAQKILDVYDEKNQSYDINEKVKVLHLSELLPTNTVPLKYLKTVDDSQKGGAIAYGCQEAINEKNDAVIYTDADNSVHLGQIGLLIKPIVNNQETNIVIGNRKHPKSNLVKQEARWGIGIKLLRHIQRMIGKEIFSKNIKDTQAAFKIFNSKILRKILDKTKTFNFSFDTDWLLFALSNNEKIEQVPFSFIDSAAESASITQGPMTTWFALLKGLTKSVRQYNVDHNMEMAKVLDEEITSSHDLDKIINHLPPELENISDNQIGDPKIMPPSEIRDWIKKCKNQKI